MKPELTPELKERFFAQYWMQRVFYVKDEANDDYDIDGAFRDAHDCEKDRIYALLRPSSSITDEEAIDVAKIMWPLVETSQTVQEGRDFLVYIANGGRVYADLSDYLRSIGIAIPFMGYSIEELVEAGWIKLVAEEVAQS